MKLVYTQSVNAILWALASRENHTYGVDHIELTSREYAELSGDLYANQLTEPFLFKGHKVVVED